MLLVLFMHVHVISDVIKPPILIPLISFVMKTIIHRGDLALLLVNKEKHVFMVVLFSVNKEKHVSTVVFFSENSRNLYTDVTSA